MKQSIAALVLLFQLFAQNSFSQTSVASIDKALSDTYKRMRDADYEVRYDSIAPYFKRQLAGHLSSPLTMNNTLDSLETLIIIRQSPDKRIKFYSWDELTGGTWHEINSFVQFKGIKDSVLYRQLDTDKEMELGGYTDSEIYEVNEIGERQNVYYLTFGWGTHGSGSHHQIMRLFKIDGNDLVLCPAFKGATELVVEYPRMDKLNLKFNKKTNSISFDEFAQRDQEHFARKTGRRERLRFSDGSFK